MKDPRFPKLVVFINALVPLAMLGWDASQHQLGPNPVKSAIHTTGLLALSFLLLSLAVTPVRLITGRNWLSHFRRMLGLYAFFYGMVHLSIYFVFDREMSLSSLISETVKRPFILYGMTALLLMSPLAATSTNAAIKRLGSARWKRLHQLAYICGALGLIHFYNSSKVTTPLQVSYATILFLLLYRVLVKQFPWLKYKPPTPARRVTSAA